MKMPHALDEDFGDNDFGFKFADEAELIALTDENATSQTSRRKSIFGDNKPSSKRLAIASPTVSTSALTALTQNFGLKTFRLKREQAISRVLNWGSAIVIFPTVGAKSLCYQVPAVCLEAREIEQARSEGQHGITLVVSPLTAFMKDQVDYLTKCGIRAAAMESSKSRENYLQICKELRRGTIKLICCSPEKLNDESFVEQMKFVWGGIRPLAVDEAHYTSQWGHAFRPDYLKLSRFARRSMQSG